MLTQKYSWPADKAREFADFLEPMLDYDTRRRATAWQCLNHEWIAGVREVCSSALSPRQNVTMSKKSQSSSPGRYDIQYGTYRPKLERGIFSAPAYGRRNLVGTCNEIIEKTREISKSAKSSPRYYSGVDKIIETKVVNNRRKLQ